MALAWVSFWPIVISTADHIGMRHMLCWRSPAMIGGAFAGGAIYIWNGTLRGPGRDHRPYCQETAWIDLRFVVGEMVCCIRTIRSTDLSRVWKRRAGDWSCWCALAPKDVCAGIGRVNNLWPQCLSNDFTRAYLDFLNRRLDWCWLDCCWPGYTSVFEQACDSTWTLKMLRLYRFTRALDRGA